jgi:hypothetical protein
MRAAWLSPLGHRADHGLDADDCDGSDDWISISTPTLPPMAMRVFQLRVGLTHGFKFVDRSNERESLRRLRIQAARG